MSIIATSRFGCMMLRGLVYLSPADDISRRINAAFPPSVHFGAVLGAVPAAAAE
jgi:hypothetical protein